ncbi:MAG: TIGR03936 family radical SAM-associated protein [Peptococcaceae bacterium]|nr:TIGR03936 family radical SAM-associated protein [Peptococcaceae bacterium]
MPRYRIRYSKEGAARFMSHLDLARTFERVLRRAGLPVTLSRGFNPHSRLAFGFPLPVGVAGLEEYVDMDLDRDISPAEIIRSINSAMPPGLKATGSCRLEERAPALMSEVERSTYLVRFDRGDAPDLETVRQCLERVMGLPEVPVARRKKDGPPVPFDIRPGILSLSAREEDGRMVVEMELMAGSSLNVRPGEVIQALGERCGIFGGNCRPEITRTGSRGRGGKELFGCCSGRVEKC